MLTGSLVAIVTPMHAGGALDVDALRSLIDWHVAEGTAGIVIVGTTGESPTVDYDEHCLLIKTAVEHAGKRVPVIAGTGANSTREAIELKRYSEADGEIARIAKALEDEAALAESLDIGGDWLAVGLDVRPASLEGYPWRRHRHPLVTALAAELYEAGVRRFVFSHVADEAGRATVEQVVAEIDAEVLVAGGVRSLAQLHGLRQAGVHGVILGEVLFTGAIDLADAIAAIR